MMLARNAESLYWIGRYVERADDTARILDVAVHQLLDDATVAARFAELEADLMALELTAIRVSGSSNDGRPDPASSILKLRGSELQQQVLELAVDVAHLQAGLLDHRDGGTHRTHGRGPLPRP